MMMMTMIRWIPILAYRLTSIYSTVQSLSATPLVYTDTRRRLMYFTALRQELLYFVYRSRAAKVAIGASSTPAAVNEEEEEKDFA